MAIRGILFDKDGVLLDYHRTFDPLNRAVALHACGGDTARADDLLRHCGYDTAVTRAQAGSLIAVATIHEIADVMVAWAGASAAITTPAAKLREDIIRMFGLGPPDSYLVADCRETLLALKSLGLFIGIATNDSMDGLRNSLGPHGILDLFDFAAGYDAGFGGKPSPGMALEFARVCDIRPDEMIIVGDNAHDIECGRRAEAARCVGVLTGTSGRAELDALADVVLESIADLPAYLAR